MTHIAASLAIHIGETFTCSAVSSKDGFERGKEVKVFIHCRESPNIKVPTALLLNPDRSFHSFGDKADTNYRAITESEGEDESSYHYFQNLHDVKAVCKSEKLKDMTGKLTSVSDVFFHLISFIKTKHVTDLPEYGLKQKYYMCVITIPERWGYIGKQLIREAAEKAGIPRDWLIVVSEPAVAAFSLHTDDNPDTMAFYREFNNGKQYIVVDLQGKTVDISWHEHGGRLKQLFPSKGRELGGDSVTEEILKFLEEIYGEKCLVKVKGKHAHEYEDLVRSIRKKICRNITDTDRNIIFKSDLPFEFVTQDNIDVSRFQDSVNVRNGTLRIRKEQWCRLFENTITAIGANIEKVLQDNMLQNVEFLLMVGEFSQCELITSAIRKKFPQKQIIIPNNPELAVVKGAVCFGFLWESMLAQYKAKYTYGIQDWPKFDKAKHPLDKLVVIDGVPRCKDVFLKYIEQGHDIPENQRASLMWTPFTSDSSDTIDCTVYVSSESDPMFTDDDGCTVLGVLHPPFTVDKRKEQARIEQTIIFRPTCITLTAKNLSTGETCETQIEYM